jgi:hypothetical protein
MHLTVSFARHGHLPLLKYVGQEQTENRFYLQHLSDLTTDE